MKSAVYVLKGDAVENSRQISADQGRFIFVIMGVDIYYGDTTIGVMWKTTLGELSRGEDKLGERHRIILKQYFKIDN